MSSAREAGWHHIPGGPRGSKTSDDGRWAIWPVAGQPQRFVLDDRGRPVGEADQTMTWAEAMAHVRTSGDSG